MSSESQGHKGRKPSPPGRSAAQSELFGRCLPLVWTLFWLVSGHFGAKGLP